ncbi:NIPSNAP family protein [Solihabitans fulvus]|uniref:NIPSNAP family protein n=1 Tax=Solihabitans fulvus TaxID=1892852 RepID=A0A5B2XJI3_9PSEU|nr:NIPSNAP family protein [Solihabitans fulvus]KAA2262990.1 NIPSNAP family protein [Solihabitans fulvus]
MTPVLELRQYTLHPGQRDTLIDIYERNFVESQEELGVRIPGHFRDVDNPDLFVWLREFDDMAARERALTAFYLKGSVWRANRTAANATMVDSDNVRLLRPVGEHSRFAAPTAPRPPVGATELPASRVTATVYHLENPADAEFVRFFEEQALPALTAAGAAPIAWFETEPAENNFPVLPVVTGEHLFVWFARFHDERSLLDHADALADSDAWRGTVAPTLSKYLARAPQEIVLAPAARSHLR